MINTDEYAEASMLATRICIRDLGLDPESSITTAEQKDLDDCTTNLPAHSRKQAEEILNGRWEAVEMLAERLRTPCTLTADEAREYTR